jgi:hypothetical protein
VPRHVPAACDDDGPPEDLVFTEGTIINTDVDCNVPLVTQVGGPEICIIRYRSITIEAGVDVSVQGLRALALVATGRRAGLHTYHFVLIGHDDT